MTAVQRFARLLPERADVGLRVEERRHGDAARARRRDEEADGQPDVLQPARGLRLRKAEVGEDQLRVAGALPQQLLHAEEEDGGGTAALEERRARGNRLGGTGSEERARRNGLGGTGSEKRARRNGFGETGPMGQEEWYGRNGPDRHGEMVSE